MRLPLLHISRLATTTTDAAPDHLTAEQLHELFTDLTDADARTPGVAGLLAGMTPVFSLDHPFIPILGPADPAQLTTWMRTTAHHGLASFWRVPATVDGPDTPLDRTDLPLILGHGVIPVLDGPGDTPLTSLGPAELRTRLSNAREAFTAHFGLPPTWISPPPPIVGTATDELVRREIHRAGFHGILVPARLAGPDTADLDACRPDHALPWRDLGPSDDLTQLCDWITGSWRARSTTRLRRLADDTRRLTDHLFPDA